MKESVIVKMQLTGQGLINDFGFFLMMSSCQNIAISFDKKNLVGIIPMLSLIMCIIVFIMNTAYLIRYSPKARIIANGVVHLAGYIIISLGCIYSFHLVIIGAALFGFGSIFGEVCHFGYLKLFPSEFIGPFVSGTGISGLTGSLLYLFLHAKEVPDWLIFICLFPLGIIYIVSFIIISKVSESRNHFNSDQN